MKPTYWDAALAHLSKEDPTLSRLIEKHPHVSLSTRGPAFTTLARAIVGQQISVKVAQSIWGRVIASFPTLRPGEILQADVSHLRSLGLSGQKVVYLKDLSRHFEEGLIRPRQFSRLEDEELIARLCAVKGIGRWTAEMYLIFNLHRPDVFPVQDIGVIRAVERHFLGGRGADRGTLAALGDRWKPYRTVATWYLWRSLDPVPLEY